MKRLTLSEAARRLKMSEDAVRKLTLGAEEPGVEDKGTDNYAGVGDNTQRSWWDYVVGASGLAVLFGGLIYALGLFALFTPIARTHTHDVTTAWHATFLVPRAVVAGLGVGQLVAFPLIAALLMLAWIIVIRRRLLVKINDKYEGELSGTLILIPLAFGVGFYSAWRLNTGPGPWSNVAYAETWPFVFFAFGLLLVFSDLRMDLRKRVYTSAIVIVVVLVVASYLGYRQWSQTPTLGGFFWAWIDMTIGAAAAFTVSLGANRASDILEYRSEQEASRWKILRASIVVTAGAFIGAFLFTIPSTPHCRWWISTSRIRTRTFAAHYSHIPKATGTYSKNERHRQEVSSPPSPTMRSRQHGSQRAQDSRSSEAPPAPSRIAPGQDHRRGSGALAWSSCISHRGGAIDYPRSGGKRSRFLSPRHPRLCSRRTPSLRGRRRNARGRRSEPLRCRRDRRWMGVRVGCATLCGVHSVPPFSVGQVPGYISNTCGATLGCQGL
jgi:hypothetical protein